MSVDHRFYFTAASLPGRAAERQDQLPQARVLFPITFMRLYPHGGYLNPGYGAWGLGAAIQFTIALCLLMLAGGDLEGPYPEADRPYRISWITARLFNTLGGLHLLGSCVTTGVVLVGYLGLPAFLCPLALITVVNWGLLFWTAAYSHYIINQVQDLQKVRLQHMRHPEWNPLRDIDYSEKWAYENQTALAYVAYMSIVEVACYFAGLVYSKDSTTGTRATTWFYSSVLMLLSGMILYLLTALPKYRAVGIVWFVLWALLIVVVVLQQYWWYRTFAVVISVIFFLSAAYSLTMWIVAATSFAHTKKYTIWWKNMTPQDVTSLTDAQYSWLKACSLSNFGQYFLFECLSTTALCIMALYSMLYSIFSVFTEKPPAAEKKKEDSTDQTQQADEQAELNRESQDAEEPEEQA